LVIVNPGVLLTVLKMFLLFNFYLCYIEIVQIQHALLPYRINDFDLIFSQLYFTTKCDSKKNRIETGLK